MRVNRTSAAIAATVSAALLGIFPNTSAAAEHALGSALPAHYAAPYLEIGSYNTDNMAADMKATGTKYFKLAFLTPSSGCNSVWEADDSNGVGAYKTQISALQSAGGNVIPSFGGGAGGELAQTCTNTSNLTSAYSKVVSTYGTNRLDFDVEGPVLSDTASTSRRDSALAALQKQNPAVQVEFTLPLAPNGLPSQEMNLLKDAKSKGVKVSVVNLMAMDFGDGQNPLNDAESGTKATASQLADLYGISSAQAYGMIGITPIAGQNDDDENFTQSDAKALETFAAGKGVAELSFWEVYSFDRATGYAYSKIFNAITG